MKRLWILVLIIILFSSLAYAVGLDPVPGEFVGVDPYRYEVEIQRVYISDISNVSITVIDNNEQAGADGIFSGYDLVSIFIDIDGSLNTTDDRYYPESYNFVTGDVRPTTNIQWMPTADHPGPTWGSLALNVIDHETARFEELYTIISAINTNDDPPNNGFLSLGDGGSLEVVFNPEILSLTPFYLILGEGGGSEHVTVIIFDETTINDVLNFFDQSVADGSLEGIGRGNSANGRLNALRNMLETASDLIDIGDIEGACGQLKAASKKCDGASPPPDFVTGEAVEELNHMISELMQELGCE